MSRDREELEQIVREVLRHLLERGMLEAPTVTVGTAGKLFSKSWTSFTREAAPSASPISIEERDHTHNGSCSHCNPLEKLTPQGLESLGADRLCVCHPTENCSPIARRIDHTLLNPSATQEEIARLCEEARRFCFASVCINPSYVSYAAQLLRGSGVSVCTVVGFPLGSTTSTVKAIETRDAIANGADEVDMVINIGALKSGNEASVLEDIRAVREAARGKVLKVILETAYLSREEKVRACRLAQQAGADFVKTSTGFGPSGATVEDVALLRETVGPRMGVKAAGGIRDEQTVRAMLQAGATRIGASASVAIVTGPGPEGMLSRHSPTVVGSHRPGEEKY